MLNNCIQFGDLIFHQIRGVAMGMSPAPTIANLYVAIYELSHILPAAQGRVSWQTDTGKVPKKQNITGIRSSGLAR